MQGTTTIDDALGAFLADQRSRLSERTMHHYDDVVGLLSDSLNRYGPDLLPSDELQRWREAYQAGDENAYCHLFGPDRIVDHYGQFLGDFMIRKVMAGQELLRAAGTVTKKLATWLHAHGHLDDDQRDAALDRGSDASRDLPRAEQLARLLYQQSRATPEIDPDTLAEGDYAEDQFVIEEVEPGALHFGEGLFTAERIGPVKVSPKASGLAKVGWRVTLTLARSRGTWKILEVGSVYPDQ
jgi:hypothetical protein